MGYETYRVRRQFQWNANVLAPAGACDCPCAPCSNQTGTGCVECQKVHCKCTCTINEHNYVGDIWVVEEGNLRKEVMLMHRFAIGDASIPPLDMIKNEPWIAAQMGYAGQINADVEAAKENLKARKAAKAG